MRKRGKTRGVIAGLVPAISIGMAQSSITGMAGTSPAMTKWELPRLLLLLPMCHLGLGAGYRIRTCDPVITNHVLYQLS